MKRGFSLIELLTVIAIVAILAVAAMAAFNSIGRAGNLSKEGADIAGLLEQARAHAMAQSTCVWVGFEEEADDKLVVGVAASRNGDLNPTADDVVPLGRLKHFDHIKVVALPDNLPHRASGDGVKQLTSVDSAIFPFTAGAGSKARTFDRWVVQFNSQGESRVVSGQLHKILEIGLQKVVNGAVVTPGNYVAVQLGGLSGAVSIHRP